MKNKTTSLKKFMVFCAMVLAIVVILQILNWLPLAMDADIPRSYPSIEDASRDIGMKNVYMPAYFPQSLEWPPNEVYALKEPMAMLTNYREHGGKRIALSIIQIESGSEPPFDSRLRLEDIGPAREINLMGRSAMMFNASCADGGDCYRITWDDGGYSFIVVGRGPEDELLKIAESVVKG